MATMSCGRTWVDNESITSTKLNASVNDATISGIVNADIAAGAAITDNKLAQITTASKVNYSALTGTVPAAIFNAIYPVGIVVTLGVSTNPATLFGIGTWTAIEGKVIVGLASAGTFNTLDSTGGSQTHKITTEELPYSINTSEIRASGSDNGGYQRVITTKTADDFSILNPYIVKYVWQRTE